MNDQGICDRSKKLDVFREPRSRQILGHHHECAFECPAARPQRMGIPHRRAVPLERLEPENRLARKSLAGSLEKIPDPADRSRYHHGSTITGLSLRFHRYTLIGKFRTFLNTHLVEGLPTSVRYFTKIVFQKHYENPIFFRDFAEARHE